HVATRMLAPDHPRLVAGDPGLALDPRPHHVVGIDLLAVAEHPAPAGGGVAQAGELASKPPRLRALAPHQLAAIVHLQRPWPRDDDATPAAQEASARIVPFIDANAAGDGRRSRGGAGPRLGAPARLLAAGAGNAGI